MFKAKGNNIGLTDSDYLHERNPSAFGITDYSVGSAWKLQKAGAVYKDESIYGFRDYGWLNGLTKSGHKISGGEKVKTYVNGTGLKISSIIGPCITVGKKRGAKWSDLRACPDNNKKTREKGQIITRHMDVDWVPLVNQQETGGKFSYLSNGMCMAKIDYKRGDVSALYFVFGVGTGFENKTKDLNGDQMTWNEGNRLVSAGGNVCNLFDKLTKQYGFNLTLPLTYSGSFEGKLNANSVITLGSDKGRTFYWNGKKGNEGYFGILQGMLVQCRKGGNGVYQKCTGRETLERKSVIKDYIYGGKSRENSTIIGVTVKSKDEVNRRDGGFYFKDFNWRRERKTAKYTVE